MATQRGKTHSLMLDNHVAACQAGEFVQPLPKTAKLTVPRSRQRST